MRCRFRLLAAEVDVPFEFVGKITGASPMAKAGHVERCPSAARHDG